MTWWTTVDDLVLPRQVAGHPALELVNTRSGWHEPYDEATQDYLRSYDHLAVLAHHTGLVDEDRIGRLRRRAVRSRDDSAAEVERARRVRRDLHDLVLGDASRAATERLGAGIARARARQRLVVADTGTRWDFPTATLQDPVDAFLVAAGELLVDAPRVGSCPGSGCGWLFVDGSGRRRWCQMAVCGNRAKQAAHARRSTRAHGG